MRQLFDDPLFQMFAERAIMTMTRGGAEYGECAATAARVSLGNVDSWYREWIATAERVALGVKRAQSAGTRSAPGTHIFGRAPIIGSLSIRCSARLSIRAWLRPSIGKRSASTGLPR